MSLRILLTALVALLRPADFTPVALMLRKPLAEPLRRLLDLAEVLRFDFAPTLRREIVLAIFHSSVFLIRLEMRNASRAPRRLEQCVCQLTSSN